MVNASVIISFYNKLDYLKLVLAGFTNQTEQNFEIIIADDGSDKSILAELKKIIPEYPFRIKHIWQEDNGFRKNKILNKAIVSSESNYLIFIDGDCIPHYKFVEEHLLNQKQKTVLTGRRVNLSEKITKQLTEEKIKNRFIENNFFKILIDSIFGKSTDTEKGIYLKNNFLRKIFNRKSRGILGCNFSIDKENILQINGFDQRYQSPSIGEDTDIQFRLELNGIKVNSLNNIAIQYHLYHKPLIRTNINLKLFEEVKNQKIIYTPFGINT